MRPRILHPLAERRQSRLRRKQRAGRQGREAHARAGLPSSGRAPTASIARVAIDPAVQRARAAGGPRDCASYTCSCGYLFVASVSTSVACPHCGAGQAW
ncbi:MAG TPA: hypothetical protein VKG38_11495 [Solirubrobacteraceae bacterium]|nr:hypothetical protein [Solirubrobacteraceae bacterium]